MSSAQAPVQDLPTAVPTATSKKDYKGFVAGVFSGITKLSGKLSLETILRLSCFEPINLSQLLSALC
jgi:hypothetical protein